MIFGASMGSSVSVDNKTKDILTFGEGRIQEVDDTTLTAEKNYSIIFIETRKKFCLRLYYNGAKSYLFC